ncbi:MAG: hypothetical protein QMC23_06155 [Rubritalea sp.]
MKYFPFYLIALFMLGSALHAQEPEQQEEGEKKAGRLAWFIATHIPKDLDTPVMVMIGTKLTEVTLSKRSPSQPVKIPKDGVIKIVKEVPNPEKPDESILLTLAEARISEDVKKAMIILVPTGKQEGSSLIFRSKVKDLAGFRGGESLYINLSKMNVAVRLGGKDIALKPGDIKVHSATRVKKPTNMAISYHYMHPVKKDWELISASTVVMRPTRREICIFSWDTRFKRLNYHGVTFPVTK